MAILTDLKDPRVRDVTVTRRRGHARHAASQDPRLDHGDETRQNLSLRGLQISAGFLQSKVAKRIDTRYTPRLTFMLDLGVKRSIEISQILSQVFGAPGRWATGFGDGRFVGRSACQSDESADDPLAADAETAEEK